MPVYISAWLLRSRAEKRRVGGFFGKNRVVGGGRAIFKGRGIGGEVGAEVSSSGELIKRRESKVICHRERRWRECSSRDKNVISYLVSADREDPS